MDDLTISEVVRRYHDRPTQIDRASLARISHEREEAGRRLARTRDVLTWQRQTAQLDAEEQVARGAVEPDRLSAAEIVAYLRSLPSLWTDSGPAGRQALATALFARTDVTGFEKLEYELTPDAIEPGLGDALPAVFEIGKNVQGSASTNGSTYRLPMIVRCAAAIDARAGSPTQVLAPS